MAKRKRKVQVEDRPRLRHNTVYNQVASDAWVDVSDLCVHIHKCKNGVMVEIWHVEGEEPIAVAEALSQPAVPGIKVRRSGWKGAI